ncbi:MAG: hypothetical protein IKD62_03540 [Oscillospiraceae bacterium]|nr:hypothetical protein [Oscillospiraceae bacterium]
MDKYIMRFVPESKKDAIRDCWRDSDGMWIMLNDGWEASRMDSGCHTIHEDYMKDLRYQIGGIRKEEV